MHVDVERPVHVRVRAQDEHGEEIVVEAAGLEARVIQHEIDHLDGVLILDRTSRDQRKEAMRALREALAATSRGLSDRLPRHLRLRRGVLERLAASRAPPGARRHPARPPGGPRARGSPRRRSPSAARELGLEVDQPEIVNDRRRARADRRRRSPTAVVVCAFGALIKEPLLSEHELLNVHPSLLPRWRGAAPVERAIMAGDERDRRRRSCA